MAGNGQFRVQEAVPRVFSVASVVNPISVSGFEGCIDFGLVGGNLIHNKAAVSHTDRHSAPALIRDH